MSKQICMRVTVRGKVQAVSFRASTKAEAQALNVCGYAKNLSDGSVEVLACGDENNVMKLCAWLKTGPKLARVDECKSEQVVFVPHANFQIL